VPKAKVVRVASVMTGTGMAPADAGPEVSPQATIADAAPLFLDGAETVRVVEGGCEIGVLRREDVLRLVLGG
jgi:glycine betaine/proline transport system ATP-binding protein